MDLRIISLFVVLFIGANAHTIIVDGVDGDDHYEHMLQSITDLQSTVISLQTTVVNLEGVVCKQTTELEHMEEKVEKLESTETNLQSTVTNLEEVVTNETTELEDMEEKVEKLEEKQLEMEENLMKCEGMVEEQNSTIEAVQGELQELAANISTIECSCNSSSEITTTTAPTTMEPTTTAPPTSCKPMKDTEDGVYTITVNNSPLQVYCQDGWTVIQKRYDGSLDYNRNFSQYADGFGSTADEHWIGLNNMHDLTSTGNWTLRFDLTAFNGETAWAEYDDFRIDPGTDFTLWFDQSSYRGTAGNSLDYNHGRKFTTSDMDQDSNGGNCAGAWGGGWWFGSCSNSQTTGMPYGGGRAIYWLHWKKYEVLKAATMKIIPN